MARYQAIIRGNRGEASRLGTRKSGIRAMARGWEGGAKVIMWEGEDGRDHLSVTIGPHHNVGQKTILHGPIADLIEEVEEC